MAPARRWRQAFSLAAAITAIEGNKVPGNDTGIQVTGTGNLIIRNSASGNTTNYVFTGTQTFGPTNEITGEVTDTNPWRNFSE